MSKFMTPRKVDRLRLPEAGAEQHKAVFDILAGAGIEVGALSRSYQYTIEDYESVVAGVVAYQKPDGSLGAFAGRLVLDLREFNRPRLGREDLRLAAAVVHQTKLDPAFVVYGDMFAGGSKVMLFNDTEIVEASKQDMVDAGTEYLAINTLIFNY